MQNKASILELRKQSSESLALCQSLVKDSWSPNAGSFSLFGSTLTLQSALCTAVAQTVKSASGEGKRLYTAQFCNHSSEWDPQDCNLILNFISPIFIGIFLLLLCENNGLYYVHLNTLYDLYGVMSFSYSCIFQRVTFTHRISLQEIQQ